MLKLLVIDTETTGLCDLRTPYDEYSLKNVWPYCTQIAWSVLEVSDDLTKQQEISSRSYLIKPRYPETQYSSEVAELTGISYQELATSGHDIDKVLEEFFAQLEEVNAVVAHNAVFDMKMIKAEVMRLGWDNHMRIVPWIDTCYQAMRLCNLRQPNGRMKFPTLTEFYQRVTGKIQDSAHNALSDVNTLIVAFHGLCTIPVTDKFGNSEPIMNKRHFQAIVDKFNASQQGLVAPINESSN